MSLQTELARGQKELSTGRHADQGVALGVRAGRSYVLGDVKDTVTAILSSNTIVATRLESTQLAYSNLASNARSLRSTILSAYNNGGDRQAIETQARVALGIYVSTLNAGDGQSYLFSGINSDTPPINNYQSTPPSANKLALDAAFTTFFGFPQTSPAVATITSAQLQTFIDGPFSALFTSPAWNTDWSNASDQTQRGQISLSLTVETSATANDPALQKLAMAYTMMSDLGSDLMSASTYRTLLENTTQTIDAGIGMLTKSQARVGVLQHQVTMATEMMNIQAGAIDSQISDLEGVDPIEAATRVNGLMTQIETAYTLTAKISQLSLTRYL